MNKKSLTKEELARLSPDERWENGIEHNPLSRKIYKLLEESDWKYGKDYFCWKSGGDGDNGEILMYILDCYFANNPRWTISEQ